MSEPFIENRKPRIRSRRASRELALKIAYAMEMRSCSMEEIIEDSMVTQNELPPAYTVRLLSHSEEYREFLDETIRLKVHKWEFHRIAIIDRIILRLSASELLYFPDIPPKVSINEAIEIAKKYSTAQSSRFVNGVLDAIYGDLEKGKIIYDDSSKNGP